ncbi:unnamed protein product [Urochloa humidicola]
MEPPVSWETSVHGRLFRPASPAALAAYINPPTPTRSPLKPQTRILNSHKLHNSDRRLRALKPTSAAPRKQDKKEMAGVAKASWMVSMSVGAVEALKDQAGLCRWNYALRSVQRNAKANVRSFAQAKNLAPAAAVAEKRRADKAEEGMRTVMYLSCWGPN